MRVATAALRTVTAPISTASTGRTRRPTLRPSPSLRARRRAELLERQRLETLQVDLSRSQMRDVFDFQKAVARRNPEVGQTGQIEFGDYLVNGFRQRLVDDDQPLALLFVGDRGHHYVEVAFVVAAVTDDLLEDLFDLDMRHHFAADFRKSAGAVGDRDEPLRVDPGDVTRRVPAIV